LDCGAEAVSTLRSATALQNPSGDFATDGDDIQPAP